MRASISFVPLSRRAAVLMLVLFMAAVTYAQITPSDDAYINSALPTTNYGAAATLNLQTAADTAFIRFDFTAVPTGYTGASIAKATLKLYVNTVTTAGSFNVDYVTGTWVEQTIKYSLQPTIGTTIVAGVPLTTASKGKYVEVDITPAMVAWLNNTQPNDGIALVANSPLVATFDSKENTAASHAPEVDIVFAGGGTITGVTTASGSGLMGGGTSGTLNLSLLTSCSSGQVLKWNGSTWACSSAGTGTITGVTAGTDLTGGGTSGKVTLNLDITKVPQLGTANTFTGNQTVNGNLSATGLVTGTAFNIGSNLFAFGSYSLGNAFLGFAGNSITTGTYNTGGGFQALFSNTTGNYNMAIGNYALHANTTGVGNTASGSDALYSNTTGYSNTASGYQALGANTAGFYNTATGASALYSNTTDSYNTANGFQALYANTTGSSNTASGFNSLYLNTTGIGNTASGYGALTYNTTGNNNTALGNNAGPDNNSPNLKNATAIGYNAVVSQSNALVLGGTGATAVSVGIGTAKPAYTLDVQGSGRFTQPIVFAASQTFPGTGTLTGVIAGTDLTGGGTTGNVTLNVDTTKVVTGVVAGTDLTGGGTGGVQTLNLDITRVPQLAANNTFTGNQTVNGVVSDVNGGIYSDVSTGTQAVYGINRNDSYPASGLTGIGAGTTQQVFGVKGFTDSSIGAGVYGSGTSLSGGVGVFGTGAQYGVQGTTPSTTIVYPSWPAGVYGLSEYTYEFGGSGVQGENNTNGELSNSPIGGTNDGNGSLLFVSNAAGYSCWGDWQANWNCSGSSSSVVDVDNGARKIALYSVQAPQNWFEDLGSGQLSHGSTVVHLEPVFAQTVNSGLEYHVFLTPNGDCKGLYASRKSPTSFEVHELGGGTSNVEFDYRVVALRKGYENVRLADRTRLFELAKQMAQKAREAHLHVPAKIEPAKLPQHPPLPAAPRTNPPVPQQHVAVPEPPK
jgi:hypothetical protein